MPHLVENWKPYLLDAWLPWGCRRKSGMCTLGKFLLSPGFQVALETRAHGKGRRECACLKDAGDETFWGDGGEPVFPKDCRHWRKGQEQEGSRDAVNSRRAAGAEGGSAFRPPAPVRFCRLLRSPGGPQLSESIIVLNCLKSRPWKAAASHRSLN